MAVSSVLYFTCLRIYEFIGQNHQITFLRYFTNVSVHKFSHKRFGYIYSFMQDFLA